jgi:hypothetical protein
MSENPGRNRNQIDTFNPDIPEPPPRESDIAEINIIILKPAAGSVSPQELVSTPLESKRDDKGDDYYIVEQTIAGTVYGILPISIERRIFDENNHTLRNKTKITLESHINLEDEVYELVSIVCFVSSPDHYVAYYKCDEGDNWIFYNDLGINLNKMTGGTKCKDDIEDIFKSWLEKYSEFVSQKLEEFDNNLSTIINDSEDIITDSLNTELLPEIIEQVCKKKNYDIINIFKKWWETLKKKAKAQWDEIKETDYYKDLKTKKTRVRSSEQEAIYNKFKRFEDSRKEVVHKLIELLGPKKAARPTRSTRPTLSTMPPRTATNNP